MTHPMPPEIESKMPIPEEIRVKLHEHCKEKYSNPEQWWDVKQGARWMFELMSERENSLRWSIDELNMENTSFHIAINNAQTDFKKLTEENAALRDKVNNQSNGEVVPMNNELLVIKEKEIISLRQENDVLKLEITNLTHSRDQADKVANETGLALQKERNRITRLESALKFYRDENNWLKKDGHACSAIIADTGTRAKLALEGSGS